MRLPALQAALLLGLVAGCAHDPKTAEAPKPTAQYRTLYGKPLTSLGAKYALLTAAAQTTVLAEVGSAQIYDVEKKRQGELVYYIITFRDNSVYPPLYVAADGSVLNPDLSVLLAAPKEVAPGSAGPVSLKDLPPEVKKVLDQQAPDAEVASIYREMWGDHPLYVITFKDELHHPTLRLSAEGIMIRTAPKSVSAPSSH